MVNKRLGLIILSMLTIMLGSMIVMAENSATPNPAEVGTEVTVFVGTGLSKSITYNILFNAVDTGVDLTTNDTGTGQGSAKVTIPEIKAGPYNFNITKTTESVLIPFTVTNSKPVVTTDSLTSYVGSKTIDTVMASDKNGKELKSCSIASSTDSLINGNINTEISTTSKDTCILTFKDGKEPKSSDVGTHTFNITATDEQNAVSIAKTITLTVKDYVEIGTNIKLKDTTGDTGDHMPGDTIELTITVKNDLSKDIDNLVVNIDNSDLDIDVDSDEITINKNDAETVTLSFEIPSDAEKGTFPITITADGEDEDGISRSAETTYDIKVTRNAHSLTIRDVTLDKSDLTCGDKAKLTFSIYNNGEKDEDDIIVTLKNAPLGILETLEKFDLGSGNDEDFTIDIEIPAKAYDKTFEFTLEAKYGSLYATDKVSVKVANCNAEMITLESESLALSPGDKLKIPITIENIGSSKQTYEIKITGLEDVGTYKGDIDLKKISVDATSTENITITLTSNESAAVGSYEAELELYINGEKIASKPITLTVEEGGLLTGFAIFGGGGSEVWLSIIIIIVIGAAGYFAYKLWLKKMLAKNSEEEEKAEEEPEEKEEDSDEGEDESKIVFDDEAPKKKKKKRKK